MAIHKFQVGQSAMYNPPARYFRAVSGTYKVLRQLPAQDGELTYRIIDAGEMQAVVLIEVSTT